MNEHEQVLSEEELDFLREMMNIGAGNAATAFRQMLQCKVEVVIPDVAVLSPQEAIYTLGDPSLPVTCAKMSTLGDVLGDLFLIIEDEQKARLTHLVEQAVGLPDRKAPLADYKVKNLPSSLQSLKLEDLSVFSEISNILAGVYLTAIHDFCKLNIYHSVPTLGTDMIQALLDESITVLSNGIQPIILVKNEFAVVETQVVTFLLMFPSKESLQRLINSIKDARRKYGFE